MMWDTMPPERAKQYVGLLLTAGVGAVLLGVHTSHALGEDENFQTFLLGILLPAACATGVFIGSIWLWRWEGSADAMVRVGIWCTLGAIVLAIGGASVILYQQQYGVVMDEQLFVVINGGSVGALVGFIVGVYDNRRQQAQARVDRLNSQLTVLNRVLRHDIRNSANVIQGNAELLIEDTVDTAAKAGSIKQQATDLVKLSEQAKQIEEILGEEGQEEYVVDIVPVIESACEQVRNDHPNVEIETSLPDSQHVIAHQFVDSALLNVIENAVEHNDSDTPRVTVASRVTTEDGTDYVELRVADNGPGIAAAEIDVLERGYETDLEHASGVGLWLVNWIVTNADGRISFAENEPRGSVVSLAMKSAKEDNASVPFSYTANAAG
jgi:signal transduction histidine kinase